MRENKKYLLLLAGVTAIVCSCMFLPNLIAHIPVTYGTDLKPEQFFFNMEFTNLLNTFFKTRTLPFYSWSMFLGTNFYASQTFYIMGDPFTWASLLLQGLNFFDRTLVLEIIKFFVSSFSMYFLLREIHISPKISVFGSLCYAFSGWAIFFSGQLMFHSFYCLAPLYFCGIEKYLQSGKKMLFLFSAALLLTTHWYFFYTLSFLTPLYYIYRYSLLKSNFKKFMPDTLNLIGVYFIGVMIAGVVLIPTLSYMTGNNRIGLNVTLLFQDPQVYLHLLTSMFVPNYQYIYGVNIFETNWHVTREICIWAGSLTALLICQIFWINDKVFKKKTLLFYFVLVLFALFPIGDAALHGFSEPSFRWTFLLTLFNILIACYLLEHFEIIDTKKIYFTAIAICVFCLLIIPFSALIEGKLEHVFSNYLYQIILFTVCSVLILINAYLLKHKLINILIVLSIFEFSISGGFHYINKMDTSERGSYEFVDKVTHVLQDEDHELNNYLNYLDENNYTEYYRVYVPHDSLYWNYSHNLSVAYQLNGLMIYDSTYSPSLNKLAEMNPDIRAFNSGMIFDIKDGQLMNFLNVKYALVLKSEELPKGVNWKLIQDDYRGNISIYENEGYRPLGTTYNTVTTYKEFKKNNNLIDLNDIIVCEESDLEEIQDYLLPSKNKSALVNIQYGGNQLVGDLYSEENSFMIITLPFDEGWKILVNGEEAKKYNVNGGFIGIPVKQGQNKVEMYFMPSGFKLGLLISGVGGVLAIILYFIERKNISKKKLEK